MTRRPPTTPRPGLAPRTALLLGTILFALLAFAPLASASKQVVDFLSGEEGTVGGQGDFYHPEGLAVNDSGAGPADLGDIYVVNENDIQLTEKPSRIERFSRDDNGTPADSTDDTYHFISTWGVDVDSNPAGGSDYEICTVAAECKIGGASGGNGTLAGNGSLQKPSGIAVDQDSGNVYVADTANQRVNVYDGAGAFLRSFGWDVVESGPDDNGTGYEVCKAGVDVCKAGTAGSGVGQIGAAPVFDERGIAVSPSDGNPTTGTVFLADAGNRRVNTYDLDGAAPSSFGSAAVFDSGPQQVAVDSRGIVYASNSKNTNEIERYDTQDANGGGVGFLAPIVAGVDEEQQLKVAATAGTFRLHFGGEETPDIPFDATGEAFRTLLRTIGDGSISSNLSGKGDATGSNPHTIFFRDALGAKDVPQLTVTNGSVPLTGGAGASVTTSVPGQSGLVPGFGPTNGLAIDPDSDGAGPDSDVLYVGRGTGSRIVQQFGPLNAPGLVAPPVAEDDRHATQPTLSNAGWLALDQQTGRLYVGASNLSSGFSSRGIYVLGDSGPPPTATLDSVSNPTSHGFTVNATVDPNGAPDTSFRVEYSTDGVNWKATPYQVVGHQETPQAVQATIEPPDGSISPNTLYHVRLLAQRRFLNAFIATPAELTITTAPAPPLVETAGAPIRTATTARLGARVDPRASATTYRFEYGSQGPCDANPCESTPSRAAGSADAVQLVEEELSDLQPDTTYHFRALADNGVAGSPVAGEDATFTTAATDAPLTHGGYPGPPGSDRAWELVSLSDSGGNPTSLVQGFSADGNRALYGIAGGTPLGEFGSLLGLYLSERPQGAHPTSGWQTRLITPKRSESEVSGWSPQVLGASDLSPILVQSASLQAGGDSSGSPLWRLSAEQPPSELLHPAGPPIFAGFRAEQRLYGTSADASRVVAVLKGGVPDPAYPAAGALPNLYDVSTGSPQLLSFLPGGTVPACGVGDSTAGFESAFHSTYIGEVANSHWVSPGGSQVLFPSSGNECSGPSQLYLREIDAGETKLISGPPLSGPSCTASLIKRSADEAVFFATQSRLAADDEAPASCSADRDVYRYDLVTEGLECVTCLPGGLAANVSSASVSEDGSRVYFGSPNHLTPEAPPSGSGGLYRLNVASGEIAYVAPVDPDTMTTDGKLVFFGSSDPFLNPLGGMANGATNQIYRYDDSDRSLVCVSCPRDNTAPAVSVLSPESHGSSALSLTQLAENGTFAFSTATPLVGADQNTPSSGNLKVGIDLYEWRPGGRLLLVSDGLTKWTAVAGPTPIGIDPSGRDLFFTASTDYTHDAIDTYRRLYVARIGGGIDFPPEAKPCPLEVCQGTPKGAPEERAPGSGTLAGPGNRAAKPPARCAKGKVRRKGRCVTKRRSQKKQRRTANSDRRTQR